MTVTKTVDSVIARMTAAEICRYYLNMTKVFRWSIDDPQHHDNRCPIHGRRLR